MKNTSCGSKREVFSNSSDGKWPTMSTSCGCVCARRFTFPKLCYAILRCLLMAFFCVRYRMDAKLFLWFPGVKYYRTLQQRVRKNHANTVVTTQKQTNFLFFKLSSNQQTSMNTASLIHFFHHKTSSAIAAWFMTRGTMISTHNAL